MGKATPILMMPLILLTCLFLDHEPPKSSIHGRWGDGCLFPGYVSFNLVMRNACGIDIMSMLLLRIRFREIGSFDLCLSKWVIYIVYRI